MPEQPTSLPRWATDGGRTLEPSSGEKDTGWEVEKKPPARKMNWLFNIIYQWTQYLQTPVGTGSGAGVDATGGSTNGPGLKGTGGATNGVGVQGFGAGTGSGIKGTGGATSGIGVEGTGAGTGSGIKGTGGSTNGIGVLGQGGDSTGIGVKGIAGENAIGVEGVGTEANPGVKGTGGESDAAGVYGVGGITNGIGVEGLASGTGSGIKGTGGGTDSSIGLEGTSNATNGNGALGTGTGTGYGVKGLSVNGHGVIAESDTTSPAKSALSIVSQDTEPSVTPSIGDIYIKTSDGKIRNYNGEEWERQVPLVYSNTDIESLSNTVAGVPRLFSNQGSYTIHSNLLSPGSFIRTNFRAKISAFAGYPGNIQVFVSIGTQVLSSFGVLSTLALDDEYWMDFTSNITIGGGTPATRRWNVKGISGYDAGGNTLLAQVNDYTYDTTSQNALRAAVIFSTTTNSITVDLTSFQVEVVNP